MKLRVLQREELVNHKKSLTEEYRWTCLSEPDSVGRTQHRRAWVHGGMYLHFELHVHVCLTPKSFRKALLCIQGHLNCQIITVEVSEKL
jgi:hypothetical protein